MEDVKFFELDDYADHMTLDEFIDACKSGMFINYDGFGKYAMADKQTNIETYPSLIMAGKIDRRFTHVMWYNR